MLIFNNNITFLLQQGDTVLMMATKKGMTDIVKLLLDHGAEINSTDKVNNRRP